MTKLNDAEKTALKTLSALKVNKKIHIRTYNALYSKIITAPTVNKINKIMSKLDEDLKVVGDEKMTKKLVLKVKKEIAKPKVINKVVKKLSYVIDKEAIDNGYNFLFHGIQIQLLQKKAPKGSLIVHTVEFFPATANFGFAGALMGMKTANEYKDIVETFKKIKFNQIAIHAIEIAMTTTDGTYEWIPALIAGLGGYTIITTKAIQKVIVSKKKHTVFKDNESENCLYSGVLSYFESKMDDNRNAKAVYNKLIKEEKKYSKPYEMHEIKELASFCNASINIKDLINGDNETFSGGHNRFSIELMNTKYNHVDLLAHNYNEVEIVDDLRAMNGIKKNSKFYIEKYGQLITLEKTYKLKEDPFKVVFNDWKQKNKFENKFINKSSDEYKLLMNYDYKLHTFFNKFDINDELYKEIDLKKAYFNYSDINYNKFYVGVPSGSFINYSTGSDFDYSKLNKRIVGFFQVKIVSSNLDDRLGFINGSVHVLFSSVINLLISVGVKFEFLNVSLSVSCHMPFDDRFLQKTKILVDGVEYDDIKYYCKAYGLFLRDSNDIDITIKPLKCDKEYFSTITNDNFNMYHNKDANNDHIVEINFIDKDPKSYCHIAYAIHSYITTIILDQLIQMNLDYVFGVKLDSIVIKKDYDFKFNLNLLQEMAFDESIFEEKKANVYSMLNNNYNKHSNEINNNDYGFDEEINLFQELPFYDYGFNANVIYHSKEPIFNRSFTSLELNKWSYDSSYYRPYVLPIVNEEIKFDECFLYSGDYIYNILVFIGGKGGAGKSNSILRKLKNKNICYTTGAWNLISGMKSKFSEINGYSLPNLTGKCGSVKTEKHSNNNIKYMVIDEPTLISKNIIDDVISEYPDIFIFLVGDIREDGFYFQCSINNNVINPSTYDLQYVEYTKSFRFEPELDLKLDNLRQTMLLYKDDLNRNKKLFDYVKESFSGNFKDLKDITFNHRDIGISDLNDLKNDNVLTNYFIEHGAKPQYYIKNTIFNKMQWKGQKLDSIPDHKNYECKLFKTIHSFQGLDLDNDNKIIIAVMSNFDYNLFYTALSRAKRCDQIVIINDLQNL